MVMTHTAVYPLNPAEAARLAAARRGDQHQFGELTEPYRRELRVHCYRILGSLQEAEDLVQETLLRAWRRLETFEGRATFRAWLYKIATHACLDALDRQRARRRMPPAAYSATNPDQPPAAPHFEPVWLEPFPDEWLAEAAIGPEARYTLRESVALAFVAALQNLPPRQRAVLILSDVLDWPAREIAELLGMTAPAVNSALHRARATMARIRPPRDTRPALPDNQLRALLERYIRAWESADVDGLVALLKEDATLTMPPSPSWYRGPAAIGAFCAATVFADDGLFPGRAAGRWRLRPTRANGQPAFGLYQRDESSGAYRPAGVQVLTFAGEALAEIASFLDPAVVQAFPFPASPEAR